MTKVKSNAAWNGLSKQQQTALAEWLFEERLGYNAALERARKELGFTGSRSSLRRFYQRTAEERTLAGFTEAGRLAASVTGAPVGREELRSAGMKVAAQAFLRMVTERPDEPKTWLPVARLLEQAEKNESWRAVKDEENRIRREALRFSMVRHQYDAIEAAAELQPKLEEMQEAQEEAELTVYERNKRLNDMRRGMFGDAIPELLPENEEEEAHPEIIEQRYREAERKQNEQFAREYQERQREWAEFEAKRAKKKEAQKPAERTGEVAGENGAGNEDEELAEEQLGHGVDAGAQTGGEPQMAGETAAGTGSSDEPRRLTAEERQREYEELMSRSRGGGPRTD
jgi:hypothetical protein